MVNILINNGREGWLSINIIGKKEKKIKKRLPHHKNKEKYKLVLLNNCISLLLKNNTSCQIFFSFFENSDLDSLLNICCRIIN